METRLFLPNNPNTAKHNFPPGAHKRLSRRVLQFLGLLTSSNPSTLKLGGLPPIRPSSLQPVLVCRPTPSDHHPLNT